MHCKPNVLPAVVHPTKCCVNNTFQNNIVPHIHPSHTTTVNHVNYEHQHYFPHTQSVQNVVTNTQANMGPAPVPFPVPQQPAQPGGVPFTATGLAYPGAAPGGPGGFPGGQGGFPGGPGGFPGGFPRR